jgi:four helix bundle protein
MMSYDRLDAWRVCHELALAIYRSTDRLSRETRDHHLERLRLAAILAPAKLAHGSARQSRKVFQRFVETALGYLVEVAYYIRLGRERRLFGDEDVRQLTALRGRATFYTWKLYLSLAPSPDTGPPRDA